MNERIRAIWETNDSIPVVWPETGSPVHVSAALLEKFAELLIRECVGVVNANMDDILDQPVFNPTDEIWNRARVEELVRVALHIKKHFGFEE